MRERSDSAAMRVIIFTLSYIFAAGVLAAVRGNAEFVFYIAIMLLLGAAIYWVHSKVGLSPALLWCLSVWGLMHMAGGLLECPAAWPTAGKTRVLYNLWIIPGYFKYDQLTHVYGFGVTTWLCWQALSESLRGEGVEVVRPTLGRLTLCAAAGMGFGAFNEIVEFVATLTIPETNVGGYRNTGWDLVSNLAGCLIAGVWIRIAHRSP